MRTCVIEVPDILLDFPAQMTLTQDQDVIQQFTPDAANEALADRIGFGGFDWCMDHINASALRDAFELVAILAIVVADQKARSCAKWRSFAKLLGHPSITR